MSARRPDKTTILGSSRLESSPLPTSDEDLEGSDYLSGRRSRSYASSTTASRSAIPSTVELTRAFLHESTRRYDRKTMNLVEKSLEVYITAFFACI